MAAVAVEIRVTDARTRSLELADARGETACSWSAHTMGYTTAEDGSLISLALEVRSATSDQLYAVGYLATRDDASCDCQAARHSRPCWHRGLGILCGRELRRIFSPQGRAAAERLYRRQQAAEDNAAALLPSL